MVVHIRESLPELLDSLGPAVEQGRRGRSCGLGSWETGGPADLQLGSLNRRTSVVTKCIFSVDMH